MAGTHMHAVNVMSALECMDSTIINSGTGNGPKRHLEHSVQV